MKENARLKSDKSLRSSRQIGLPQYTSATSTYPSVISEDEGSMKYEPYSEQSAKDPKDGEFRRSGHDSPASFLPRTNSEAPAVVNFSFSFSFSPDSDIIASDYDEDFSPLSSSSRPYFRLLAPSPFSRSHPRLLAPIPVFSLLFPSFRSHPRLFAPIPVFKPRGYRSTQSDGSSDSVCSAAIESNISRVQRADQAYKDQTSNARFQQ